MIHSQITENKTSASQHLSVQSNQCFKRKKTQHETRTKNYSNDDD